MVNMSIPVSCIYIFLPSSRKMQPTAPILKQLKLLRALWLAVMMHPTRQCRQMLAIAVPLTRETLHLQMAVEMQNSRRAKQPIIMQKVILQALATSPPFRQSDSQSMACKICSLLL